MKLSTILASASLAVFSVALPASAAYQVNGSFETAGGGGAADADNWLELTSGAPNVVARTNASASAGSFAMRMYSQGQTGIGTSATLQQITNQAVPAGD